MPPITSLDDETRPFFIAQLYYAADRRNRKNILDSIVHPDVSKALRGPEHEVLQEIEAYLGSVDVAADRTVHPGQFDFAAI